MAEEITLTLDECDLVLVLLDNIDDSLSGAQIEHPDSETLAQSREDVDALWKMIEGAMKRASGEVPDA